MSVAILLLLGLTLSPQETPAAGVPAPAVPSGEPSAGTPGTDDARLAKVRERRAALEQELARLRGEEKSLLGEVEQL